MLSCLMINTLKISEIYEAADIFDLLFEGLVRIDENGKIVPGLAEKWETNKDKTKWTFHLRKD